MKTRVLVYAAFCVSFLATAQAGYWQSGSGEVWRNSFGECWHTGAWDPTMAIVGCDGNEAEAAVPVPVAVAAPAAMPPLDAMVKFGFDRADIGAEAAAALDTLLRQARGSGRIRSVKATGHADRIGAESYNLDLSLRRATAVSDYLSGSAGLDPQIIEVGGRGEAEPLVGCEGERGAATIRCLAPNRRAEVMFDIF